jgi:hypothetical protein
MAGRTQHERERRFARRFGRGIATGLILGAVVGAAIGLIAGSATVGFASRGMWLAVVAGVVAGSILGWFVGGMATLDFPEPGQEPSDSVLQKPDPEGGRRDEIIEHRDERR